MKYFMVVFLSSIEDAGLGHGHRSNPTNDTKRKSKQTMTDSPRATDQRKTKQSALSSPNKGITMLDRIH